MATSILYFSGGYGAPTDFSLLFYLLIIASAVRLGLPGALATAIVVSVLYTVIGGLTGCRCCHADDAHKKRKCSDDSAISLTHDGSSFRSGVLAIRVSASRTLQLLQRIVSAIFPSIFALPRATPSAT